MDVFKVPRDQLDVLVRQQSDDALATKPNGIDPSPVKAHKGRMEQYIADVKRGVFSNDWVDAQLKQDNCLFE